MRRSDWDGFWARSREGRFTRVSWSKRRIERVLDPYLLPGAKVLDAGCGSGYFSTHFLSKRCRVVALDHSEEALEITRKATGNRAEAYLKEDLLDPGFEERHRGSFDLAFSDGLLEHFAPADQRMIVAHLAAALRPGGLLATFVPNAFSWWTLLRPLFMPGIHERPLRPREIRDLHGGLDLLREGGLNVLPFRFSPERALGSWFGMLLFVLARRGNEPT